MPKRTIGDAVSRLRNLLKAVKQDAVTIEQLRKNEEQLKTATKENEELKRIIGELTIRMSMEAKKGLSRG